MARWSQRIVRGLVGIVALFVAVLLFHWITATDPIAAAKDQAGAAAASLLGSEVSDGPLGGRAKVRLQSRDKDAGPVEIELRRPFWSRHWR
jgi:hypothetical protein